MLALLATLALFALALFTAPALPVPAELTLGRWRPVCAMPWRYWSGATLATYARANSAANGRTVTPGIRGRLQDGQRQDQRARDPPENLGWLSGIQCREGVPLYPHN